MKQLFSPYFRLQYICLLCMFFLSTGIKAQDSIVVYSDTTSALLSAEPDDSLWCPSSSATVWEEDFFSDDFFDHDMFGFLSGILGITGIISIIFYALFLLFPLLAIGVIIYLIYRLKREKRRNAEQSVSNTPECESTRIARNKELALRRACWGVGLILVEWIADITDLLSIIGVVLVCMAAFNWLSIQIRK